MPMQKKASRCLPTFLSRTLYPLLFITLLTLIIFSFNISYPYINLPTTIITRDNIVLPFTLHTQISHLQNQLGGLLEQLHTENTESKFVAKFADQLLGITLSVDRLAGELSHLYGDPGPETDPPLSQTRPSEEEEEAATANEDSDDTEVEEEESIKMVMSKELRNYSSPKPNRQNGKRNFLGVEAVYPSIGLSCIGVASSIDRFMSYKTHSTCPDDSVVAQKLIINGCDPLPRRRCFSRSPQRYTKPLPIISSLWSPPAGNNILWTQYKCKDYSCLTSNGIRGFFKCGDCFNLSKRGWEESSSSSLSVSPEFSIDEVLKLKPDEIRIGLDFSPTTGTFAAIMRERNVTIASATLNLGAPFNEVIALRGLLPIYVSIGSRLPFFDNTLDIIHSTLFLDGWIGLEVLQYVLFDWDRVLRPKGILWIDRFFCSKEDMKLYLEEFVKLGYKKLLWRVVPKMDKQGDELFFSGVLEKPIRV